jgi:hypothetical protein
MSTEKIASNDPNRIEALSKKMREGATVAAPEKGKEHIAELEVPEAIILEALGERGITRDQIKEVATGVVELTRAAHHCATVHNIDRIKTAVKSKTDPRNFETRVSGNVGRSLQINASSKAMREGEITTPTGEKKSYRTFGTGKGQAIMGGGLGAAMSSDLAEKVKNAFDGCEYLK